MNTVPVASAVGHSRGIRTYSPDIEPDILAFQHIAYPSRRRDWVEPRWRWMFLGSAARLGVDPMVWVYRNRDGVVAHQGAIAVRVKINDDERVTGWFVETMALESVRGKAIGPMLVAKALQDLPFNLSLGQTPQMRALQFSLGWQQVCPLASWAFVLNPSRVLTGKLRNRPVRAAAAMALRLRQQAKYLVGRRRTRWIPEVRILDRFEPRHDRLWNGVKHQFTCAVVRDSSYLNWKYVDQPGQDFIRLELRRGDDAVAVAALLIREPDDVYRYRRGFIVDLLLPVQDGDVTWTVLDEVRKIFVASAVDMIVFDVISAPLARAVASFGFFAREPQRFFLVALDEAAGPALVPALRPEHWLVTMGDSDIDRPW